MSFIVMSEKVRQTEKEYPVWTEWLGRIYDIALELVNVGEAGLYSK